MTTLCVVCNKLFDKKVTKGYNLVPNVCSGDCFHTMIIGEQKFPLETMDGIKFLPTDSVDYKSDYEIKFMEWAKKRKLKPIYEPFLFTFGKFKGYIPDFLVNGSVIVETKGLWMNGAYPKVSGLRDYLKLIVPVYVVNADLLRRILK